MKGILVICCGNALASDDGVGPLIAKRLQSLSLPEDVEVIDAGTPGLTLLDIMLGAHKVIIVDATITGAKPGTVQKYDLKGLEAREEQVTSLHELPLMAALEIAREVHLEKMPDDVVVIGIEAESVEKPRTGLTESVERAIPEAMEAILREINEGISHR